MGQKRTMGSGSCWGKKGQRDQAAVGARKDKGIRQQLGKERTKGSSSKSTWKDEGMKAAVSVGKLVGRSETNFVEF